MSYESLSHSRWECKYHVVFVPKYNVSSTEKLEKRASYLLNDVC